MTRRAALRLFAGTGAALVAVAAGGGAALSQVGTQQHTSQLYTVSANGNFRAGPSTSHAILGVVRPGNTFTLRGQTQNGYAAIRFQDRDGWVIADLVVAAGSTPTTPVISGQGRTTSSVNLRSGPSTSHSILRVVPSGVTIGTSTTVTNGFRYVSYAGQTGWMANTYISFTGDTGNGPVPNYHIATANLNLRAEPSTSAKVLLVIPSGAKVTPHGLTTNGFAKVTYNGTVGWASGQYLK